MKDEKTRAEEYDNGRAWQEVYRARYLVIQKRVLCSMPAEWQEKFFDMIGEIEEVLKLDYGEVSGFSVTPYKDFSYNSETDEEELIECHDPLADYRHTGPLPLKNQCRAAEDDPDLG